MKSQTEYNSYYSFHSIIVCQKQKKLGVEILRGSSRTNSNKILDATETKKYKISQ